MIETYINRDVDLNGLASDIEAWLKSSYDIIQSKKISSTYIIQARICRSRRPRVGGKRTFSVFIQGESNNFTVELDMEEWEDKYPWLFFIWTGLYLLFRKNTILTDLCAIKIRIDVSDIINKCIIINSRNPILDQPPIVVYKSRFRQNLRQVMNMFKYVVLRLLRKICG